MSEESKPEELRLPDELAALEALLAAKPLTAAGIDRDQLMYRAGWAACEANALQPRPSAGGRVASLDMATDSRGYPRAEPGAARERRRLAVWSLGSAALAASLAVMATLEWQGSASLEEKERAGGETPRLAVEEGLPQTLTEVKSFTARDVSAAEVERVLNSNGRDERLTLAGPWFAMQRQGLVGSTSGDSVRAERVTANGVAPPTAKTARELWKELNPNETTPPTPVWPWGRPLSGDSI